MKYKFYLLVTDFVIQLSIFYIHLTTFLFIHSHVCIQKIVTCASTI